MNVLKLLTAVCFFIACLAAYFAGLFCIARYSVELAGGTALITASIILYGLVKAALNDE